MKTIAGISMTTFVHTTEAGQVNANDPDFKESNVMRCKIMKISHSLYPIVLLL